MRKIEMEISLVPKSPDKKNPPIRREGPPHGPKTKTKINYRNWTKLRLRTKRR